MEVPALCTTLSVKVLLLLAAAQSCYCVHKADAGFLHINPNRLQFFEYESISFTCAGFHSPAEWRVMSESPSARWETATGSLSITPAFVSNSGEYWCENRDGERSNTVSITVTGGDVILDSPALPVMERQTVTLHCRRKGTSSKSPADFYRDGNFSETGYAGMMTIHSVSKSHQGLYKCSISGATGESPESWLAVRAYVGPPPQGEGHITLHHQGQESPIQLSVPISVVFSVVFLAVLLSVVGLLQCRKHRVACFSSEMPKTIAVPACEHDSAAEPSIYVNVTNQRKKRAHEHASAADPPVCANEAQHTKRRVKTTSGEGQYVSASEQCSIADQQMSVYANITAHKKKRVPNEANAAGTKQNKTKEGKRSLKAGTPERTMEDSVSAL